ncbi:MAG: DJ-1/PfpI family protein [Lentisphaeria bacterium]|nr:DJ-1/PfpI family protein [Lentisphaeria bacterium]
MDKVKTALVIFADGFEEIEAVGTVDVLRRLNVEVTTAALNWKRAVGAHGMELSVDASLGEACMGDYDAVILPGGMPGAANLAADEQVADVLKRAAERGAVIAAVCAAPFVLAQQGLLDGKKFTMYPGFEDRLNGLKPHTDQAVRDGNVVTGRGPGAVFDFVREIAAALGLKRECEELYKGMFVK